MIKNIFLLITLFFLMACNENDQSGVKNPSDVTFVTLDPGHFHASLVQKTMLPGVDSNVYVYAPAGPDLDQHLKRIDGFNNRAENPTHWDEIVYTGADFFDKMIREKKGNVVVMAGNNQKKTEYILKTIEAEMYWQINQWPSTKPVLKCLKLLSTKPKKKMYCYTIS